MQNPVYFLVLDHDSKKFNVLGPIYDDQKWTNKIADLKGEGRNIKCSTFEATENRTAKIKEYEQAQGYTYTDELLVPELSEA